MRSDAFKRRLAFGFIVIIDAKQKQPVAVKKGRCQAK